MLKFKSNKKVGWLLVLLWTFTNTCFSQSIAFETPIQKEQRENVNPQTEYRALKDVLKELEDLFKVHFMFESKIIEGKKVKPPRIASKIEDMLNEALLQTGLQYQKVNEVYVIQLLERKKELNQINRRSDLDSNDDFNNPPYLATLNPKSLGQRNLVVEEVVSGTVTSLENGEALPGVNIVVKGTTIGTLTDAEGRYKIAVPENATLVFSFVGYTSEEVPVGDKTVIDVRLSPDIQSLSEVVVVGYGTQQRRDITGSIAEIKSNDIQKAIVPSFEAALQGKVAGMQVVQSSGMPGSAVNVRIRGTGSIAGGSSPLYVIDGVPITSGQRGDGDGGISFSPSAQVNPLADISPEDIESISVLKDASAASIYGARGGNGVVLITTKRGKSGRPKFNLGYATGPVMQIKKRELLDGGEYLALLDEAVANSTTPPSNPLPNLPGFDRGVAEQTNTDWSGIALQRGKSQQAHFDVSGGTDKTAIYFGANYKEDNGIVKGNDFYRVSGRFNLDHSFTKSFKMGVSLGMNYSINYLMPNGTLPGGTGANAYQLQQTLLPVYPVTNPDNTSLNPFFNAYAGNGQVGSNIAALVNRDYYVTKRNVLRTTPVVYGEVKILPDLLFRSELGLDSYNQYDRRYFSKYVRLGAGGSVSQGQPSASARMERVAFDNLNTNNTLTYTKKVTEDHKIVGLLGMTFNRSTSIFTGGEKQDFAVDQLQYPLSGTTNLSVSGSWTAYAYVAYFARLNYSFRDKYFLEVNSRVEGSSRFGKDSRYGLFPAVSAGWTLTREEFLKNLTFLNHLKIRASYGQTGNASGIDNYQSLELWRNNSNSNYGGIGGIHPQQVPTPNLKWEKQNLFDIGIDAGFFNERITVTFDYYHKISKDMLLRVNGTQTSGFEDNGIVINAGSMKNEGVELNITTQNLVGAFKWSTNFNIAHNSNKVLDLYTLKDNQLNYNGLTVAKGKSLGTFYLAEYKGVDPETGDQLIVDADGNITAAKRPAQIDSARQYIDGKLAIPKFYGGITNDFSFKGFDLSILVTYSYGNYMLDDGERRLSYFSTDNTNLLSESMNRWTPEGRSTEFPRLIYNDPIRGSRTSRFLHDASFLRLKNITFGYTIPASIAKKARLGSVRVYFSGQNVFTATKFPGLDPEIAANLGNAQERSIGMGYTNLDMPHVQSYLFGINIGF